MMRHIFIIAVCLMVMASARAQTITGKVVDATSGKPIPNASIYLNGTSKGTSSDNTGKFSLVTAERNIPLVVSCVGYQSQIINNYNNSILHIALVPRAMDLKEVVIGGMPRAEMMKIFLTEFI